MIADILRPAAICTILLLIEISLVPWISINGLTPDLLLIYVMLTAANRGKNAGLLTGLYAGLLQDITGGGALGLLALAKCNLAFLLGLSIEKRGNSFAAWVLLPVVFISALIHNTWTALFMLQGSEIEFGYFIISDILPSALYTTFCGLLFMLTAGKTRKSHRVMNVLR